MLRGTLVLLTASIAALTINATAEASPTTALHNLTITTSRGEAVVPDREATLSCQPTGGTHRNAAKACDILNRVGGDLEGMFLHPEIMCPAHYDPITVSVTGHHFRRLVNFTKTYSNPCHLHAATDTFYAL